MPTNDFKIFGLCYDGHWCRLNGDVDEYEVARCFVCSSGGTSGNPPKMVGSKSIDAAAIGSTSFGVRVA